MRLQRYLAQCGAAARRKCEEMILEGRVRVNGELVTQMGTQIDPEKDEILLDDTPVRLAAKNTYILFNKPSGVVCTASDPQGRKTALSYFEELNTRLFLVGRLDYDSEGLILLTDDGDFANHMQHPSHQIEKEYWIRIKSVLSQEALDRLARGVYIKGDARITAPAIVRRLPGAPEGMTFLSIVLKEGRNRQVRRMIESTGHSVATLSRKRIGILSDRDLPTGAWRFLKPEEVDALNAMIKYK